MTKEELLQSIEKNVEGQFNQLDIAGVLPEILRTLADGAMGVEVENITEIDGAILDGLKCGDKVVKVTGKQKHLYLVSYKGEGAGEGICLSYNAAGYGETVSYDRTDEGWVYNSTDVKTYGA